MSSKSLVDNFRANLPGSAMSPSVVKMQLNKHS